MAGAQASSRSAPGIYKAAHRNDWCPRERAGPASGSPLKFQKIPAHARQSVPLQRKGDYEMASRPEIKVKKPAPDETAQEAPNQKAKKEPATTASGRPADQGILPDRGSGRNRADHQERTSRRAGVDLQFRRRRRQDHRAAEVKCGAGRCLPALPLEKGGGRGDLNPRRSLPAARRRLRLPSRPSAVSPVSGRVIVLRCALATQLAGAATTAHRGKGLIAAPRTLWRGLRHHEHRLAHRADDWVFQQVVNFALQPAQSRFVPSTGLDTLFPEGRGR